MVRLPTAGGNFGKWWSTMVFIVAAALTIWVVWRAAGMMSMMFSTRPTTLGRILAAGWFVSVIGFAVSLLVFAIIPWREVVPPFEHGGLWSFVRGPRPGDHGRARFWFRMRVTLTFFFGGILAMCLFAAADWAGVTR